MENLKNYLNYWDSSYWKNKSRSHYKKTDDLLDVEEAPNHIGYHFENPVVAKSISCVERLTEDNFQQLALYYYLKTNKRDSQVDQSNVSFLQSMENEGRLCKALLECYMNKDSVSLFLAFDCRTKRDEELVTSLFHVKIDSLSSIASKISMLDKNYLRKAHFGNKFLIYLNMFLFFILISSLPASNAATCCALNPSSCSYNTNEVNYNVIAMSNGYICESYLSRYHEVTTNETKDNTITECTSSIIDPVSCLNSCSTGCNGNTMFCFTHTCDGNKCFCNRKDIVYDYYCLNDESEEIGTGHLSTYHCYTQIEQDFKKRIIVSCPVVNLLSDKEYFYTTIDSDYNSCILYITKDGWSYQSAFIEPNQVVRIDEMAKARSGRFEVKVICGNNVCHHSSIFVDFTRDCVIVDCIFCWEVYSSLNCLPFSYKVFAALITLLFMSLIIAILPCFWILIKTIWMCLMFPKKCCWPYMNKKIKEADKYIKKINISDENIENSREHERENRNYDDIYEKEVVVLKADKSSDRRQQPSNSVFNRPNPNAFIYVVLLSYFIICASAITCSSSPPISVSSPSCVSTSASAESCTFTFSTTVTIPYPGASSCLTFIDSQNKVLGNMNVTYINRTDIAYLTTSYYTGRWKPLSSSFHGCYQNGWCDDSCATATTRNMYGFSSLIASWPGLTYCRRSCGCAGCGCFFCDAGCVVSGYSLQYLDSAMAVSEINRLSYTSYLSYAYSGTVQTFAQSTSSVNIGPFKVDYIGSFSGDVQTYFGTKNVIFNSTSSYWGEASSLNSPTQQNIGDIQATSLTSLQSPTTTSFIFDPNIISSVSQDKSDNFYFSNPGMNNINLYPKFPAMIGGQLWTYTTGYIKSVAISPGPVVLTVTTQSPITLTRTKTTVCPKALYLSGSGCFSCDAGSTIIIKASSTCSPGLVLVSADVAYVSISTKSIDLLTTDKNFEIDLLTTNQINSFNIILASDGNTITIPVSFAAVENVTLRNDTYTFVPGSSVGGPGFSFSFPSWADFTSALTDSNSDYHYSAIVSLVIGIIVIVLVLAISFILIKTMCTVPKAYTSI
jgi:hypothetical protein